MPGRSFGMPTTCARAPAISRPGVDLLAPDGTHMVETADELREVLAMMGETVEHLKTLDAYKLALLSGNYP